MKRFLLGLTLALAGIAIVGTATTAAAAPYGYYRHPYNCCPYAGNYQPWGVYYRPFAPYYQPYVAPRWGWGYTAPPTVGMGLGVY
jgi:hypothetical protein